MIEGFFGFACERYTAQARRRYRLSKIKPTTASLTLNVSAMDFALVLKDFQDHLAPRLDVYEQAIGGGLASHAVSRGLS